MDRSLAVRKGAWTEEEDVLLRQCIEKYGEGKWRQVPLKAGLRRCRKSCRLRWLNYLRPNIKRGELMQDEVDLLIRLHKLLGNRHVRPSKWSLIAGRLPGRTSNDIKNYWNTHFNHGLRNRNRNRNRNQGIGLLEAESAYPNSRFRQKITGTIASDRKELGTKSPVSKKNEVIKPRPWTFPKTSPWLLGSFSSSTSPKPSTTNAGTTSHKKETLSMTCPNLQSTEGSRVEQESDYFDEELEKWASGSNSGCVEDLINSLWVEDLQPMVQAKNNTSLEEGSIGWDEDFCLDFNFWDTQVVEGGLVS